MQTRIPLRAAWVQGNWRENVALELGKHGKYVKLDSLKPGETSLDLLIPGFVSAHSHAFHRFFAGDGESRNPALDDDFWSWRDAMYRESDKLDPAFYRKNAEAFFRELVSFGTTHLVEFHYVHHQKDGTHYASKTDLSEALLQAAADAGLNLCLLPTYYNKGGFRQDISPKQKRFYSKDSKSYFELTEKIEQLCQQYKQDFGYALHSLRAVELDDLSKMMDNIDSKKPVHIHISEQLKEVEDCIKIFGKRPIEVLLAAVNFRANLFLVHATHANSAELKMVHDCGANIIVCPTTEANLGDGIFPWSKFSEIANGSNLGFGTDANLSVSLWEELRTFEYSQRFIHRKRTIAAPRGCHHVADSLFESAWNTGMKNFSQDNYLNKGAPFDGLLVDGSCSTLAGCSLQNTLSRLCFRSQSNNWLKRVWTRGKIRKIEK